MSILLLTLPVSFLACASPEDIGNTYDEAALEGKYQQGVADGKAEAEANLQAMIDEALAAKLAEYATLQALADAQTAAEQHADTQASAAQTAAEQYADTQASAAQTAAEQYVDTQVATTLADAQAYADQQDSNILATADNNSQIAASDALNRATSYADQQDASILTLSYGYADGILTSATALMTSALVPVQAQVDDVDARVADIEADYLTSATLRRIRTDETWTVGASNADYATIQDAVAALDGVRIDSTATVTIHVNPGVYTLTSTIEFEHPDGRRVRIEGNPAYPSDVEIRSALDYAVHVMPGATLGYFGGVKLEGNNVGITGILVDYASVLGVGPMVIDSFAYYGMLVVGTAAEAEGSATTLGWLTLSNNADSGLHAANGGVAYLPSVESDDNGTGYDCLQGAYCGLASSSATNSTERSYRAAVGGVIYAPASVSEYAGVSGYTADSGAHIYASYASSRFSDYGFAAQHGASVYADSSTVSDMNGSHNVAYLSGYGAYLRARTSCSDTTSTDSYYTTSLGSMYVSASSGCDVETGYGSHDTTDYIVGL